MNALFLRKNARKFVEGISEYGLHIPDFNTIKRLERLKIKIGAKKIGAKKTLRQEESACPVCVLSFVAISLAPYYIY